MYALLNNPFFVGIAIFAGFFSLICIACLYRDYKEERRLRDIMEANYYSKCEEVRQLKKLYNHKEA